MAQSHLHHILAVNLSQAAASHDVELEAELRRLKSLLRQPAPLVQYALRVLRSPGMPELKGVVLSVLAVKKDARVPRAVVAFVRQETDPYLVVCAWWCLSNYDCSRYLPFITQQLARITELSEAAYILEMTLRAMKGPFTPPTARKALKVLSQWSVDTTNPYFRSLQVVQAAALETCARFFRQAVTNELVEYDKSNEAVNHSR